MKFKAIIAMLLVLMILVVGCGSTQSRYSGAATYQPNNVPAAAGGCGVAAPADVMSDQNTVQVLPSF